MRNFDCIASVIWLSVECKFILAHEESFGGTRGHYFARRQIGSRRQEHKGRHLIAVFADTSVSHKGCMALDRMEDVLEYSQAAD